MKQHEQLMWICGQKHNSKLMLMLLCVRAVSKLTCKHLQICKTHETQSNLSNDLDLYSSCDHKYNSEEMLMLRCVCWMYSQMFANKFAIFSC